jgi:hypothetical protein
VVTPMLETRDTESQGSFNLPRVAQLVSGGVRLSELCRVRIGGSGDPLRPHESRQGWGFPER